MGRAGNAVLPELSRGAVNSFIIVMHFPKVYKKSEICLNSLFLDNIEAMKIDY